MTDLVTPATPVSISPDQLGQLAQFIGEQVNSAVAAALKQRGLSAPVAASPGTWMHLGRGDARCPDCLKWEQVYGLFGDGGRVTQTHRACQNPSCEQYGPTPGATLVHG
jgi:hypothetical protein